MFHQWSPECIASLFPIHPRTRKMCGQFGIALENQPDLKILGPIGYHDSLRLTENARLVLTDSSGLRKESTYFRTPCLTLRPNTERPITVIMGSNKLTSLERLAVDIDGVRNSEPRFGQMPPALGWSGFRADCQQSARSQSAPGSPVGSHRAALTSLRVLVG